jgi:hypothetical protein
MALAGPFVSAPSRARRVLDHLDVRISHPQMVFAVIDGASAQASDFPQRDDDTLACRLPWSERWLDRRSPRHESRPAAGRDHDAVHREIGSAVAAAAAFWN